MLSSWMTCSNSFRKGSICSGRTDTVEFAGEDLEHYKCEGELGQRRADIGIFEGVLCGTELDKLSVG